MDNPKTQHERQFLWLIRWCECQTQLPKQANLVKFGRKTRDFAFLNRENVHACMRY